MLITKCIGGNFTYVELGGIELSSGLHKCLMENATMYHNNSKRCELLDIGKPGTHVL